ncbi:MAG: hypothetical protein ACLFWL_16835 [Candidatus Brocadiia bacterium]
MQDESAPPGGRYWGNCIAMYVPNKEIYMCSVFESFSDGWKMTGKGGGSYDDPIRTGYGVNRQLSRGTAIPSGEILPYYTTSNLPNPSNAIYLGHNTFGGLYPTERDWCEFDQSYAATESFAAWGAPSNQCSYPHYFTEGAVGHDLGRNPFLIADLHVEGANYSMVVAENLYNP